MARSEYETLKMQLEYELLNKSTQSQEFEIIWKKAESLNEGHEAQRDLIKSRVKSYCQKTYKKIRESKVFLSKNRIIFLQG